MLVIFACFSVCNFQEYHQNVKQFASKSGTVYYDKDKFQLYNRMAECAGHMFIGYLKAGAYSYSLVDDETIG